MPISKIGHKQNSEHSLQNPTNLFSSLAYDSYSLSWTRNIGLLFSDLCWRYFDFSKFKTFKTSKVRRSLPLSSPPLMLAVFIWAKEYWKFSWLTMEKGICNIFFSNSFDYFSKYYHVLLFFIFLITRNNVFFLMFQYLGVCWS